MPRLKLKPQASYEFRHTATVRVTDLNYGGHLGNDALVSLLHQARVKLLHLLGCSEKDLGDGQTGLIMSDLAVNFLQEGFLFDVLHIDSHIAEISRKSFRIHHRLSRVETVVALAETGLVAFDYTARRPAPIPEPFLAALDDYLAQGRQT